MLGDVKNIKSCELSSLLSGSSSPERFRNRANVVSADDTVCLHVVNYHCGALIKGKLTSVDVQLWRGRSLVGV